MGFREKVYRIVSEIPKGKVATYGQVARLAGNPKAARAVGVLMKNNPYAPAKSPAFRRAGLIVPCHRVVASDGSLTGYSGIGGIEGKRKMLREEGVVFRGEKVDLSTSLYSRTK